MRQKTTVSVFAFLLAACSGGPGNQELETSVDVIAKVRVYQDGRITMGGEVASLEDLRAAFARLKERDGVVWYYRQAGASEPHANATAVVQAIVEARLPVSLSSKEDFSDVVLPDGTTAPRE